MEFSFSNIPQFLIHYAQYTHFIAFALLILAGFNLPISEDIVYVVSASIAATIYPENTFKIFAGCFLGAYLSDLWCFFVGKYLITWILRHKRLSKHISMKKIAMLEKYFQRYGKKTLFFGRFIPFGLRNQIFITCGVLKMRTPHFIVIDFVALCFTSAILFSLGYYFGNNYTVVLNFIHKYSIILFFAVVLIIFLFVRSFLKREKTKIRIDKRP